MYTYTYIHVYIYIHIYKWHMYVSIHLSIIRNTYAIYLDDATHHPQNFMYKHELFILVYAFILYEKHVSYYLNGAYISSSAFYK